MLNPEAYEIMILELHVFITEVNDCCEVMKDAASLCMEIAEGDYAAAKEADRLCRSVAHYQEAVEAAIQLMEKLQQEREALMCALSEVDEF